PQIIALIRDKGFDYVQLNTNGKRLAADPAYGRLLKQAGLGAVFLQFDGMDDRIYQQLRGEALTAIKLRALAHCRAAALPVVLTMMVTADVNLQQIGSCFRLLLDHLPWIRGLHLQPACYSGRHPGLRQGLTLQQVLKELVAQSGGLLHQEQFSPLATGHPLCSFQGNFIRRGEQVVSVGGSSCCWGGGADIARSRRKLAQNWGERQPRQSTLPCWLDEGELQGFTVSAMAFQDGLSLDLERLRCCRVYVARPGNQLIPFCAHNISSCSGEALYPRK
ncbi:MAG: radical SAM protein, partial [Clostridiales bacterium]